MKNGLYTALPTPFSADGRLDLEVLDALIARQIDGGAQGVVVLGSTGEAATLSQTERDAVVERAVSRFSGKTCIVAGCGSNDTKQAEMLAKRYARLGVDCLLSVTPYYNKPDDDGMYEHFRVVAAAAKIPVLVYNVPSRTGCCISVETLSKLKKIGNIIGIKEASGNINYLSRVCMLVDENFKVFCGNDDILVPALSLGASGAVSVVSNLVPTAINSLVESFFEGNVARAREIQFRYYDLIEVLFADTNPLPLKAALRILGQSVGDCRLPLKSLRPENLERLVALLSPEGLV